MKTLAILLFLFAFAPNGHAQNPLSYPKDTLLSPAELNFEVLWHTFEDNYAFFALRHIDWHQTYQQFRPMITPTTSYDSLFTIFSAMLGPFQDNHINVIIPHVKQFKASKPSPFANEFPTDSAKALFWKMVDRSLNRDGFSTLKYAGPAFNNDKLFAYSRSKTLGYLRFNRCFADQAADNIIDAIKVGKILDTVFTGLGHLKGLIIDVRDNMGGNDEFAFEVAGRFTAKKIVGMYKSTRKSKGGYEEMAPPETWYIQPRGNKAFSNPVVLLTNDQTVSAGDVFAMLLKELPQVTIVGTNTRGIYSDMYGFTLPNGWLVSLSNQRYFTAGRVCYEGSGTPVDVQVRNTTADLIKDKDPLLNSALRVLKNK